MNFKYQIINFFKKAKIKIKNEYKEIFPYQNHAEGIETENSLNEIDLGKNKVLNTREEIISNINIYIDNLLFLRDNLSSKYCLNEYNKYINEIAIQRFFFEASLIELNDQDQLQYNQISYSIYFKRINLIKDFFPGLLFILLRQSFLIDEKNLNKLETKVLIKKLSSRDLINSNFYLDSILISFLVVDKNLRNSLINKIHCAENENNFIITPNDLYDKFKNKDDKFHLKIINVIKDNEKSIEFEFFIDTIQEFIDKRNFTKIAFIFIEYLYFYTPTIFIKLISKLNLGLLIENLFELKFYHLLKQVLRFNISKSTINYHKFINNNDHYYKFYSKHQSEDINLLASMQINERLKFINNRVLMKKNYNHKANIYIFGQVRSNEVLNYLVNSLSKIKNIEGISLISWSKVKPRYPNNFSEIRACHSELSASDFDFLMQKYNLNYESKTCFDKNIIPNFLKIDSNINLENKKINLRFEKEEGIYINNLELNEIGCPNHIKNQLKFIYLFKKCLDDIYSNNVKSEVYFFTRPDLYPKSDFPILFENMYESILEDNDLIACDSEENCLRVKLGGMGDRFFGIHSSKINEVKNKTEECLSNLLDILFKKETEFNKDLIKMNYDIFGAHHFIEYILFSIGTREKHFFKAPFELRRKIYNIGELEEIMKISSKIEENV